MGHNKIMKVLSVTATVVTMAASAVSAYVQTDMMVNKVADELQHNSKLQKIIIDIAQKAVNK